MKILQILAVSAAAAVTLPAFAQMTAASDKPGMRAPETRADVESRLRERLGRLDANKDGTVTREETIAMADARMKERNDAHFAAMDSDKNGTISRAEFDAGHAKGAMAMAGGPGERIVRIDKRGDLASPPVPPMPGTDDKPGERRTRVMMMGGRNGMIMADGDGKGIVIADAVKKALERFDATDTNKDGSISAEERKAQRGVWRSMR